MIPIDGEDDAELCDEVQQREKVIRICWAIGAELPRAWAMKYDPNEIR